MACEWVSEDVGKTQLYFDGPTVHEKSLLFLKLYIAVEFYEMF